MAAPEVLFCNMLNANYTATTSTINSVIRIPLFGLTKFKSTIQRSNKLIYTVVEAGVDVILSKLDELFALIDIRNYESGYNFCQVAYACEALMDQLFNSSLLNFLSDEAKQDALDNYDKFELYVCKGGLGFLINNWIDQQLDVFEAQLDLLEDKLLGVTGVDELIEAYMNFLTKPIIGDQSILDLLDLLDKFGACGFATFNFRATASNKQEDYNEQLSIDKEADSYVFVVDEALQGFLDSDTRINTKINEARLKIARWRNDNTRDEGTPPDEIMS